MNTRNPISTIQIIRELVLLFLLVFGSTTLTANAQVWQQLSSTHSHRVMDITHSSNGVIYYCVFGEGVFKSDNNGDSWIQVLPLGFHWDITSLTINTVGIIFAGDWGAGVYRSTDNGANWNQINIGLNHRRVNSLAINAEGHIFAGTSNGGIYRSTDNGENWVQINNGLTDLLVKDIKINSSGDIIAGTESYGSIFRSVDNGDTWERIFYPWTSNVMPVMCVMFNRDGIVFAGVDRGEGVYRSTDNGVTWNQDNVGLTNKHVFSLATDSLGNIYAGTYEGGVFTSINNGDTWEGVNEGLSDLKIYALDVLPNGEILAGSFRDGVFRLSNYTPSVLDIFPTQNALNVSSNSDISVTFDTDMDAATVNSSTFLVSGNYTGPYQGTVSYDPTTQTSLFDPDVDFKVGEVITITLTTSMLSSDGVALALPVMWSFTVEVVGGTAVLSAPTTYDVSDGPSCVAAADYNGDGYIDIANSNYASNNIDVLLNSGDGSFTIFSMSNTGTGPIGIITSDLNNDGIFDLATANELSNTVSVLFGDGSGQFGVHADYAVGGMPRSIAVGDLNGDGYPDLVATSRTDHTVSVLINDGTGNYTNRTDYPVNGDPLSVAIADLDNDWHLDIVTADHDSPSVSMLYNDGFGVFGNFFSFSVGNRPVGVSCGDLNGDGLMDVISADEASARISVLMNEGNRTFASAIPYPLCSNVFQPLPADMDNDGDLDIVTSNNNCASISVLLNNGDGSLNPRQDYPAASHLAYLVAADFDGDGDMDIAAPHHTVDKIGVYFNTGIPSGDKKPRVVSVSPKQDEVYVNPQIDISVTFDQEMDATTIDGTSLVVNGDVNGAYQGTITYNPVTLTATFNSNDDFVVGEIITVTLTTDILSIDSFELFQTVGWSFTIGAPASGNLLYVLEPVTCSYEFASFLVNEGYDVTEATEIPDVSTLNGYDAVIVSRGGACSQASAVRLRDYLSGGGGLLLVEGTPFSLAGGSTNLSGISDWFPATTYTNSGGTAYFDASFAPFDAQLSDRDVIVADVGLSAAAISGLSFPTHQMAHWQNDRTYAFWHEHEEGRLFYSSNVFCEALNSIENDNLGILLSSAIRWIVGENRPEVISVSPVQNKLDVDPQIDISATFDTDMDGTTVNSSTFLVSGSYTGPCQGTLSYNPETQTVVFDPDIDFLVGEKVTVVLSSGMKALDTGVGLNKYQWSFTVGVDLGTMTFIPGGTYPVGTWPHTAFAADFNGDSHIDLTTAQRTSHDMSVLLNNGDATFGNTTSYPINGESRSGISLDIDNDGDMDIATANTYGTNTISVFRNDGAGSFAPKQDYATGTQPYAITFGDFNADGFMDLATANEISNDVSILFNQGDGTFGRPQHYPATSVLRSLCTGDFDNDGDIDIATVGGTPGGSLAILRNNGEGGFIPPEIYTLGVHPWSVIAPDINGDGFVDVVVANRDSDDIHVLLNNGDGTMQTGVSYQTGDGPVSVSAADFDADTDLDIVVTNDFSNSVSIFENNGIGVLSLVTELTGYNRAYSSAPADYDGDGDIDIAVVSLGAHSVSILLNEGCNSTGLVEGMVFSESVGLEGVSVDIYDAESTLLQSTVSDVIGSFSFADLIPGDYTTSISTPLGFKAEQESQIITIECGTTIIADFLLTQLTIVPQQRARGFWMHQVNALLSGKGNPHETWDGMCGYMGLIRTHFNDHGLNPVNVFTVDLTTDCTGNLENLRESISPRRKATMNDKAKSHLTALLLNMVSGKIAQTEIISEDGATISQAITYCNLLISDTDPINDELAKNITEGINRGDMLSSGMVDLSTVQIYYKVGFDAGLPSDYYLMQNYPNPFNPETEITFSLPVGSHVKLEIFNVTGQKVETIADSYLSSGVHTVSWNASSKASGVYLYRLTTSEFVETKKMILLK